MKKGTLHLKNSPNSSCPTFHFGNLAPPPQQRCPGPLPYILAASVAYTVAASMAFSVAAKALPPDSLSQPVVPRSSMSAPEGLELVAAQRGDSDEKK